VSRPKYISGEGNLVTVLIPRSKTIMFFLSVASKEHQKGVAKNARAVGPADRLAIPSKDHAYSLRIELVGGNSKNELL
jgi:hypothetical protein